MKLTYQLPVVLVEGEEPGVPDTETLEGDMYPIINTLNVLADRLVDRGHGVPTIKSVECTPEEQISMLLISLEYGRACGGFVSTAVEEETE